MTPVALTRAPAPVQASVMLRAGLRRLGGRRFRRTAFWHLGADRLVVAVIEPADDEPLLCACATVTGQAQTPLAVGVVEAVMLVDARPLDHVAALDERYCTLLPAGGGAVQAQAVGCAAVESIEIAGPRDSTIRADGSALRWAVRCFDEARLRLSAVECATLARRWLAVHLGHDAHQPVGQAVAQGVGPDAAAFAGDPLAAVSVAGECEREACALGGLLAVPVGLAVGWFHPDVIDAAQP